MLNFHFISLKHKLFNSLPCFLIKVLQYVLPEAEELGPGLALKGLNPDLDTACLASTTKTHWHFLSAQNGV